jgi:hypothetical protein
MTEKNARQIFEKYNPAGAVTRCPNGRAIIRQELNLYARAAVNLYGVIPTKDLADIFNLQNTDKTTADEVFALLLPLVRKKNPWYCFYKGNIVHYWAIDDFDFVDVILSHHADKPRYLPAKDEFLRYAQQSYEDDRQREAWSELYKYFRATWPDNPKSFHAYEGMKDLVVQGAGIDEIVMLFAINEIVFSEESDAQKFFDLYTEAQNNTRLMDNKGYTPNELYDILQERSGSAEEEIVFKHAVKVGLNAPCPCGSGKKYKKCCRRIEQAKTAQLSESECQLFYETWFGLMGFINDKFKIQDVKIDPVFPNPVSEEQIVKIRMKLWENPALIDDYLAASSLPQEKIELLQSWRDHHVSRPFFLIRYTPEYAVALAGGVGDNRLYGVKGISNSLAEILRLRLPIAVEIVLLPFKDKIIYDSFIQTMPFDLGKGMIKQIDDWAEKAEARGIITSLGDSA